MIVKIGKVFINRHHVESISLHGGYVMVQFASGEKLLFEGEIDKIARLVDGTYATNIGWEFPAYNAEKKELK